MAKVTIDSKFDKGLVKLTVETTGASKAKLTAKTWGKQEPAASDHPIRSESHELYDVKVAPGGLRVTCKADVFLLDDPAVTFGLDPARKTVTITVVGIGAGVSTYALSAADYARLVAFVASAFL